MKSSCTKYRNTTIEIHIVACVNYVVQCYTVKPFTHPNFNLQLAEAQTGSRGRYSDWTKTLVSLNSMSLMVSRGGIPYPCIYHTAIDQLATITRAIQSLSSTQYSMETKLICSGLLVKPNVELITTQRAPFARDVSAKFPFKYHRALLLI